MKKILAFLLCIGISMSVLSGCSSSSQSVQSNKESSPSGETSTDETTPETVTYWCFSEFYIPFMELVEESWNEKHPEQPVIIESTNYPTEECHSKLLIALQSGTGAPDIADIEASLFQNFLKGEPQFLSLNSIVEPELDKIVRSRVDMYSKDGVFYGIDTHVGASVMYYNTEILENAGIDYRDLVTWDDFVSAGKTVKEKTGAYMTTWETKDTHAFLPLVSELGGSCLTEDDQFNIDSPEVIEALTFQQNTIKDGIACVAPGGGHHAEEYFGFMNDGGSASICIPVWYVGRFTDYMPDLKGKIAVAPNPVFEVGEPRSVGLGGTGTVITNQAKNPDLCLKLLYDYKLSDEGCARFWTDLGVDPIKTTLWHDESITKVHNIYNDYFVEGTIWDTLVEIEDEIPALVYTSKYTAMYNKLTTTVFYRVLENMEDPATVVKEEQEALNKEYTE